MADSSRLIDVGGGMLRISREREPQLPRNRGIETPISVVWHLIGKPSDLALIQAFAQRLGVSISWETGKKGSGSTVLARGKKMAIRESE